MEFESLGIIDLILKALKNEGYLVPTPIQVQTIPLLLGGKDVVGIAQTGTGKTAAFVIPILQGLYKEFSGVKASTPKALVLAPTRELASQISESFKSYGRFLNFKQLVVFGGVSIGPQIRSLSQGIDILIATPGRLLDLMNQGKVSLGSVKFLVLDEADRMLDMGFSKDVYKIVSSIPKSRVSSFFSATMSREVSSLTDRFLKSPVSVEVSPQATPIELIEQCVFFVDQENKCELLLDLITQHKMSRVLVFVGAKFRANRIAMFLRRNGIVSEPIHSNKSQYQRTKALSDFKSGKVHVLVATDIASRGIDVDDISHVINYDLP
ncbi:DEAD/DEAH box helicase, partial [Candidatus Pacearchaeota archaeon CG10_big_fil_rev_8_21_14_0_10_35_13]